jgi:hypothetical protein
MGDWPASELPAESPDRKTVKDAAEQTVRKQTERSAVKSSIGKWRNAGDRKSTSPCAHSFGAILSVKKIRLAQDTRVVPIDALASAKLGDDHHVNDDFFRGWS